MRSKFATIGQLVGSAGLASPVAIAGHVAVASLVAIAGLVATRLAWWCVLLVAQRRQHRHVEKLADVAAARDLALVRAVLADGRPDRAQVLEALADPKVRERTES